MPFGSCALAGTTYPLDREFVASELGFDAVPMNSLDGVSDRDYCIEIASDLLNYYDAPYPFLRRNYSMV